MTIPGRRCNHGRTIDTHTHWYPQPWIDLLERDGPREGTKLERTAHGYRISVGKLANAFSDEFVSLEPRLAGMDRQGVDVQLLSLTTPMVYWASPALGLALSQAYNDSASAAHLKPNSSPNRSAPASRAWRESSARPESRPIDAGCAMNRARGSALMALACTVALVPVPARSEPTRDELFAARHSPRAQRRTMT